MSLRVEHIAFAEATVFDARGSLAVIAFSPQAHIVQSFPSQTQLAFLFVVEDDDPVNPALVPERSITFRVSVANADGQAIFFVQQQAPLKPGPVPGLPPRVQLVGQAHVSLTKAGKHTLRIEARASDDAGGSVVAEKSVWVIDPQWINEHTPTA